MHVARLVLAAATLLLCPLAALADTTYTYTGNDFTNFSNSAFTTADSIDGSLTLASPLGDKFSGYATILSYSFSDGLETFTPTNSSVNDAIFTTNASGEIVSWTIDIELTDGTFDFISLVNSNGEQVDSAYASISSTSSEGFSYTPGTWTETTPTPEPSSVALLATGLLTAAGAIRRRIA